MQYSLVRLSLDQEMLVKPKPHHPFNFVNFVAERFFEFREVALSGIGKVSKPVAWGSSERLFGSS